MFGGFLSTEQIFYLPKKYARHSLGLQPALQGQKKNCLTSLNPWSQPVLSSPCNPPLRSIVCVGRIALTKTTLPSLTDRIAATSRTSQISACSTSFCRFHCLLCLCICWRPQSGTLGVRPPLKRGCWPCSSHQDSAEAQLGDTRSLCQRNDYSRISGALDRSGLEVCICNGERVLC